MMKIDLYTKAVLTVIAIGLLWIGINMTPAASAGPDAMQVDIVKINGQSIGPFTTPLPVQIVEK